MRDQSPGNRYHEVPQRGVVAPDRVPRRVSGEQEEGPMGVTTSSTWRGAENHELSQASPPRRQPQTGAVPGVDERGGGGGGADPMRW